MRVGRPFQIYLTTQQVNEMPVEVPK